MEPGKTGKLNGRLVLLGVTGSIAAYKSAELVRLLKKEGANVQVLATRGAERFIPALTLSTLSGNEVLIDVFPEHGPEGWTRHIDLGISADLLLIAPATAQTIAKLANGFCDNMLTAVALAARCPIAVSPAMDHDMYVHPATQRNIRLLSEMGYDVIEPEEGSLASGLTGKGRLPEPETLLKYVCAQLDRDVPDEGQLRGKKVLITAGPTREALDPVRFITNHSTGAMGYHLAESARDRGADVVLVSGPTHLQPPTGVRTISVTSASEMFETVQNFSAESDWIIMAAAVADYTLREVSESKIKKTSDSLTLSLSRTTDILATIGAAKSPHQHVVGFALETGHGLEKARGKLVAKNADWIVLNDLHDEGAGFGPGTNTVTVLGNDESVTSFPKMAKSDLAEKLWEHWLSTESI